MQKEKRAVNIIPSSREVVARDLPHPMLLLNKEKPLCFTRKAEDPGQKISGMTSLFNNGNDKIGRCRFARAASTAMTNGADRFSRSVIPQGFYAGYSERNVKAFTLIELLVVVLIIGILAAVAVPQYQKAVEKSKATQAATIISTLYQTAEANELATGRWPYSLSELDIEIPQIGNGNEWKIEITHTNTVIEGITITRLQGKYAGTGLAKYKRHPYENVPKNKIVCFENQYEILPLYTGERGSYCQKILGGTAGYVGPLVWTSMWAMP